MHKSMAQIHQAKGEKPRRKREEEKGENDMETIHGTNETMKV